MGLGIFGKDNDLAKGMEIFNKAQKGELQAILTDKVNGPQFCMIQLVKNSKDCYMLIVKDKAGREIQNFKLGWKDR